MTAPDSDPMALARDRCCLDLGPAGRARGLDPT